MSVAPPGDYAGPLSIDQLLFTTHDDWSFGFENVGVRDGSGVIPGDEGSPIWSAAASSAHSNSSTVVSAKRGRPALSERDRLAEGFSGSLEDYRAYRKRLSSKMSAQRTSAKKQYEKMAQAHQLQVVTEEYSHVYTSLSQTQVENQELKKQLEEYKVLTAKLLAMVGDKEVQPSTKIMRTMAADTSLVAPKRCGSGIQSTDCSGYSGYSSSTNVSEVGAGDEASATRRSSSGCDASSYITPPVVGSDHVDLYNNIVPADVFDDTSEAMMTFTSSSIVAPKGALGSSTPIPVPMNVPAGSLEKRDSAVRPESQFKKKKAKKINNPVPTRQHHRTPYGRHLMYIMTILCVMSVYYLDLDPAALGLEKSKGVGGGSASMSHDFEADLSDMDSDETRRSRRLLESLQFKLMDSDFAKSFLPSTFDVCSGVSSLLKIGNGHCRDMEDSHSSLPKASGGAVAGENPVASFDVSRRRGIGRRKGPRSTDDGIGSGGLPILNSTVPCVSNHNPTRSQKRMNDEIQTQASETPKVKTQDCDEFESLLELLRSAPFCCV